MTVLYCPYCLEAQNEKISCRHEVHFVPFEELDSECQDILLGDAIETKQGDLDGCI